MNLDPRAPSGAGFERLSAMDASFLFAESPELQMHLGAVQVFSPGRLSTPDGGIDVRAFRRHVASVLHLVPRCRQRLMWTPLEGWPVWVDDDRFEIEAHVRVVALPRPGTMEKLKELVGWLLEKPLDRGRPLWEICLIEGLEDGRFAALCKLHHCMVDGHAGVSLAHVLLSPDAGAATPMAPGYEPRRAPAWWRLLGEDWRRRTTTSVTALGELLSMPPGKAASEVAARVRAIGELASWALRPATKTPLNGSVSAQRRFDWLRMSLAHASTLKRAAGCTLNDLVLATVSGAVRRFLMHRGVAPDSIDFRVAAPVDRRAARDSSVSGNRLSTWIVSLPIEEPSPGRRLDRISDQTRRLKAQRSALGVETLMGLAEWLHPSALSAGARLASVPVSMIVTNVPGPQLPLYTLGARLEDLYPVVPLLDGTGLGVALFSYDGGLFWGFNASRDLVPDLPVFVSAVREAFDELAIEHGLEPAPARRESVRAPRIPATPPQAARPPMRPPVVRRPPARWEIPAQSPMASRGARTH